MGIIDCSTFATLNLMLGTLDNIRIEHVSHQNPNVCYYTSMDGVDRQLPVLWCGDHNRQQVRTCDLRTHNGSKQGNWTKNSHPVQIMGIVYHIQNLNENEFSSSANLIDGIHRQWGIVKSNKEPLSDKIMDIYHICGEGNWGNVGILEEHIFRLQAYQAKFK